MVKAGRPQGGPKGQTGQANELAAFLRDLTRDFTVRDLAERYKISKTSWGEYRSGNKTIHLHLLKRLVDDLVRDPRSHTIRWEQAQRLHAQATAALQPPAQPQPTGGGVTPLEAAAQASETMEGAERLVHMLLGVIAGLQMNAPHPTPVDPTVHQTSPDPGTAGDQAADWLREAHQRLHQVRDIHTTLSHVRDQAETAAPQTTPDPEDALSSRDEGTSLPARGTRASRPTAILLSDARTALAEQYSAVRLLTARSVGGDTAIVATTRPADVPAPPPREPGTASPSHSPRRRILAVVAATLTLIAVASGAAVVTTLNLTDAKHPRTEQAKQTPPAISSPTRFPPSISPPSSPSPSTTTSPSPRTSSSPHARNTVSTTGPESFLGTWEGEYDVPGEQLAILRRLVIGKGTDGTRTADILTSSTHALCRSTATLTTSGTHLVLAPRPISSTSDSQCSTTGPLTLSHRSDSAITVETDGTTYTLRRTAPAAQTIPAMFLGTWEAQDGADATSSVRVTIRQGAPGRARAEFAWDGDVHHCRGFSVLVSIDQNLRFGPETVTSSEPENFCTRTPTRVMSRPLGSTMQVEIAPADGERPRSLTFTRTD